MKALRAMDIEAHCDSGYPEPFRSRVLPREKRRLGDAFGLTKIGVNLTTLHPGAESSMRHWHDHEDEFIHVLEGEVILITNDGEQTLGPGMCAGFRAGDTNAHQLMNRGTRSAVYLEISNRDATDVAYYPDDDLAFGSEVDGGFIYTHKDGTPY